MSAIIFNLTVTDGQGNVILEEIFHSMAEVVMRLPEMKEDAEVYLEESSKK